MWLSEVITRRGERVDALRARNGALASKLERVKQECIGLRAVSIGLRVDPVCVERGMRGTFGLVREGETTYTPMPVSFQRATPSEPVKSGMALGGIGCLGGRRLWGRPVSFYMLSAVFSAMAIVVLLPSGATRRHE